MLSLKETDMLIKKLEDHLESYRNKAGDLAPKNEHFVCCIHLFNATYSASVWEHIKAHTDVAYKTAITSENIKHGDKVTPEQKRYSKKVHQYICELNKDL